MSFTPVCFESTQSPILSSLHVRRRRRQFTMLAMSASERRDSIHSLRAILRELDAEFEREMRARGFDPAQAENVALPSGLAKLYAERQRIRALIAEIETSESEIGKE